MQMEYPRQLLAFRRALRSALTPRYGEAEAGSIAALLLEHLTGIAPGRQGMAADFVLDDDIHAAAQAAAQRLLQGEPLQYVTGRAWFAGRLFEVSPDVLIPRGETEELVLKTVETCREMNAPSILDIGTGSGCIAISIALALPQAAVFALDLSAEALVIAQQNASRLGARIQFTQLDLRQAESNTYSGLDCIVSNPPYIPESARATLEPHVREHEPGLALFVPDETPLLYYHLIAWLGQHWLKPGGRLLLELHAPLAEEVADMLDRYGYAGVALAEDIHGRLRFAQALRVK